MPLYVAASTSSCAALAGLVATSITQSKLSDTWGVPEMVEGSRIHVTPASVDLRMPSPR